MTPRLSQLYTLQSPILATIEGERAVILAFALTVDGDLLAMTIGTGGGSVRWWGADDVDWPAPIQPAPGPGQTLRTTLDHQPPKGRAQ